MYSAVNLLSEMVDKYRRYIGFILKVNLSLRLFLFTYFLAFLRSSGEGQISDHLVQVSDQLSFLDAFFYLYGKWSR